MTTNARHQSEYTSRRTTVEEVRERGLGSTRDKEIKARKQAAEKVGEDNNAYSTYTGSEQEVYD